MAQAESLMDGGQIEGAINILERCLELDANRVDVLEPLAFAYSANGDPVLAAMTFKRIAELLPKQPEYLLYSAESLLEAKDRKGAVIRYKEYLAVRPRDRAVWTTLAGLQVESGHISEALEAYLAAEQLESRASQQVAIGELYLRSQNFAQGQAWFARALDGDSEFRDEALLGLLETAIRTKRFPEAEALLIQIDAEYPGRVDQSPIENVRDQLADWRRRREAAKAALAELEEQTARKAVVEEAPVVEQVLPEAEPETPAEEVAQVEAPAEEIPAVELPEEIPVVPPPDDHVALARQNREAGNLEEAIRHYKQALIQNDNQAWVWAELSEAYLEAGNDRWAQATASEAMRRDPENPKFVLQFLLAAQRAMEPNKLLREMENAFRKFPNQPEIVLVLARANASYGNTRNARMLYSRFLDLVPESHPMRLQAEDELARLGG
ncbi:MAG TPA: tetratricopeptide repeat protein [Oceanipulchritudo sp.]|nr:tetratricopeptide repeat protein [Oceanipulchritudo sp.]